MDSLAEKNTPLVLNDTFLIKDSQTANEIKETSLSNIKPYIWSVSDEDSALTVGIKYISIRRYMFLNPLPLIPFFSGICFKPKTAFYKYFLLLY